jgi:riboflavin biosynthesis pyrimidine reductase
LKTENARDILVLGSPRLTKFLLKETVVDVLKLTVSPVIVGSGLRLFEGIEEHLN